MTLEELERFFDDNNNDYMEFERIANPHSLRPDLNAFFLLDHLVPGIRDIISGAEHDRIYLSIWPAELARVATQENLLELIRCGICLEDSKFYMNV